MHNMPTSKQGDSRWTGPPYYHKSCNHRYI